MPKTGINLSGINGWDFAWGEGGVRERLLGNACEALHGGAAPEDV